MAEEEKKDETQEVKEEVKEDIVEAPVEAPKQDVKAEVKEEVKAEEPAQEDEEVEIPKKFKKLVEEIETMSVLDLSELVKILEKKFGVSAAMPVAMGPASAGAEGEEAPAAKSEFNIALTSYGEKKIDIIKIVKEITGKGLKDAKDLVDAVDGGTQIIKENAKKEEAEEIKKKIEGVGGKVELQ